MYTTLMPSLTGVLISQRTDLGKIIDVDKLAIQYGGNVASDKAAIENQEEYIRKGISFTQETTLSGHRTLRVIQDAKAAGYTMRMFYVGINTAEDALARIQNRVAKGGHNIPEEDVQRRFETRFENLAAVIDYCDHVFFFDNENGFVEIGEYKNGTLTTKSENPANWFVELRAYIDPFYGEANMARLGKAIGDFNGNNN